MDNETKKHLAVVAIGIVGVAVAFQFHKRSVLADVVGTEDLVGSQPESYPSAGNQQQPSYSFGDTPTYLSYNIAPPGLSQMPSKTVSPIGSSGCGCDNGGCAAVSPAPVFPPAFTLPTKFVQSQADNLASVSNWPWMRG